MIPNGISDSDSRNPQGSPLPRSPSLLIPANVSSSSFDHSFALQLISTSFSPSHPLPSPVANSPSQRSKPNSEISHNILHTEIPRSRRDSYLYTSNSPPFPLMSTSNSRSRPRVESIVQRDIAGAYTFSSEHFEELIGADADVDLDRLREAARFGIPAAIRGEVWKYLLGVTKPEKSEEMTSAKRMREDYLRLKDEAEKYGDPVVLRKIRREISRHSVAIDQDLEGLAGRIESIIVVYLSDHQATDFFPAMVHILAPLLFALREDHEADVYYAFSRLIDYIELLLNSNGIEILVARFVTLFRAFQNELCGCFEDEGLSVKEWLVPWLQSLLSKELPLENVLRLWDTYFASMEEDDLHIYVCLSILHSCKETLLEFEYSEIKAYLGNLPYLDMDQVIVQAYNIRDEAMAMRI